MEDARVKAEQRELEFGGIANTREFVAEAGQGMLVASRQLVDFPPAHNPFCNQCRKVFNKLTAMFSVRYCSYTCANYCTDCHDNEMSIIPSRVLYKWDFTMYKVSIRAKDRIDTYMNVPLFFASDFPESVFEAHLREIHTLRENIMECVPYISACPNFVLSNYMLGDRYYLYNSADKYSLQDLIDVASGKLLPKLQTLVQAVHDHVRVTCAACKGKGNICELCNAGEIMFPFYDRSVGLVCPECMGMVHTKCAEKWLRGTFTPETCPKCYRIRKLKGVK